MTMKYSLFIGCHIPARLQQYEDSARAVLDELDMEIVDINAFNCCGYPIRNIDHKAFILSAARNLALSEKAGVNMLCLCKCCFGSLKRADHILKNDPAVRDSINRVLAKEGLCYEGGIEVRHLLWALYHDVGIEAIRQKVIMPFKDLHVAAHHGCHALRPSKIVQFDDPSHPVIFDALVAATGALSIEWSKKLECCGAPLLGSNDDLSMDLTEKKLWNAEDSGAHYICTACPYCQLQFDTVQEMIRETRDIKRDPMPAILFPQLLGVGMGIDKKRLGLEMNRLGDDRVYDFLSEAPLEKEKKELS